MEGEEPFLFPGKTGSDIKKKRPKPIVDETLYDL
jgi:hypothetical protein